jgi:hypothetical protein
MLPPENEEDALRLIRNMESYYRNAFTAFADDDNYYEGLLENSVELPEGFDVTIPTTARAIIDEAVDNVEPYDMHIRYAPRNLSLAGQQDAEAVSRFLKNTWVWMRSKNSDIDILRDFIKNLFKNGKGVIKLVPDWTLWPSLDSEEEDNLSAAGKLKERVEIIKKLRQENFPIVARSMSPRHIMEDPTMDARKLWVIEKYDTSISEIRNRYAKYDQVLKEPEPYNYMVKELWTAWWVDDKGKIHPGKHFVFINETLMDTEENPFWEVPYIIKHSGFGTETYDGKPEFKATGFFTRQVKSMLRAEVRRISHFDALMQQLAFPIALLPDVLEGQDFETSPGSVNYVPEEVLANSKNIYLQAALPAPEYMQSLSMISSQIERGTTQRAVRGAGVPGTDSAAQLAMITSQAKLRLEPIKKATEEAVDMVNSMILRFVEEIFGQPVSVFCAEPDGPDRYTLKPNQIKGRYRTRTTFMPNEEQTKERKLMLLTDSMSKAQLNPYDAMVMAGIENPMEIIARNLAYQIMKEPAVMRQLGKGFLKEMGLDSMELELEELNDQSQLQQMMMQLQQRMMGGGEGEVGNPLMPQEAPSKSGQPQGGANTQTAPQAQGRPIAQPMRSEGADQAGRMLNG